MALPDGWRIEGFWDGIGSGEGRYTVVHVPGINDAAAGNADDVINSYSDNDVREADRIIVAYRHRDGQDEYRTIGGASNENQVGLLITNTIKIVSPLGGRS